MNEWNGWVGMRNGALHLEMEFLIKVSAVAQAIKTFTEFQQLMAEITTIEATLYFHEGMGMHSNIIWKDFWGGGD